MSKTRILYVSQAIQPFLPESDISRAARQIPQGIHERGREIRVFMPRFGVINERRHQLHEVIRLSGMNLNINDTDHPLIIKVASIPTARMQVYFIDNEHYFKKKVTWFDAKDKLVSDNDERAIFFARGVLETVRKLSWAPDIIHCHGWMTALVPFFIREAYKTEPLFYNSKIIYSLYNTIINQEFGESFLKKAAINALSQDDLSAFVSDGKVDLYKGAVAYADALIKGSEEMKEDIQALIASADKPVLDFQNDEQLQAAYINFYNALLEEAVSSE